MKRYKDVKFQLWKLNYQNRNILFFKNLPPVCLPKYANFIAKKAIFLLTLTLTIFRIEERVKKNFPIYQLFLVTSADVGISLQNLLTFSLSLFATMVQNLKTIPSTSRKILNVNQKKLVFLVKYF